MESFANEVTEWAALKSQINQAIQDFTTTNAAKMQYVAECKSSADIAEQKRIALQQGIAARK